MLKMSQGLPKIELRSFKCQSDVLTAELLELWEMQLEQRTNDIVSQTWLDSQAESPLGIESALCLKCCLLKTGLIPRPHPFTMDTR